MFIISLILVFIIKLRFPPHKSIREIILGRYSNEVLQIFRQCERTDIKLRKCKCDIEFIDTCITNKLVPKFIQFKLYSRRLQSEHLYRKFQKNLLFHELKNRKEDYDRLVNDRAHIYNRLKVMMSTIDFNHICNYIESNNNKKEQDVENRQCRKLFNLGFNAKPEILKPEDVIYNYSHRILTDKEKQALSFGLKYCFSTKKLNYSKYFTSFEKVFNTLNGYDIYKKSIDTENVFLSKLKHIAFSTYYRFRPYLTEEQKCMIKTLKQLAKDKSVIITKPDKGNGIVLLNKSDYINKMNTILEDRSKFVINTKDTFTAVIQAEDKVNRFVNELHKKGIIDDKQKKELRATGTKPGIMYGSPKVHKRGAPTRPVLSTIKTPNYSLSKFLVETLKPIVGNAYTIKDSFEFCKLMSGTRNNNYHMASYDVISLFTNIPIAETIDIIINKLFPYPDSIYKNFDKKTFHKLLQLCTQNNIFIFNDILYTQIDSAPMGGCVSPTLADIFMCFHEHNWLNNCPLEFKPLMYKRYVDDIFTLFRSPDHIVLFKDYLNSQHPSIKFTCDTEVESCMSFLDVSVTKDNDSFNTSVFRKKTFTGLGMKYDSNVCDHFKYNLIQCLVHRAYNICSSYILLVKELDFIKTLFLKNKFPLYKIEKYIGDKLNALFENKTKPLTVPKKSIYLSIPFISHFDNRVIKRELNKLISEFFPQLKLHIIFTNNNSIQNMFPFKDKITPSLLSGVVYYYKCTQCGADYCGETNRHMKVRIAEHGGLSYRTNRPLSNCNSVIFKHAIDNDHPVNPNNFKVLATVPQSDLYITESIFIHSMKTKLNIQSSSIPLHILS